MFMPSDDSVLEKSYNPFESKNYSTKSKSVSTGSNLISSSTEEKNTDSKRKVFKINYRAKQVIERELDGGSNIASGSNFIGKLLTSIDTRENNQFLKVILPYGGGSLPKDSILWGSATYSGGKRIYLQFSKVIFPTGREFKISAIALSSSDYTAGLIGNKHSQVDLRLAGSLGMTLISSAADVLTDRTNEMSAYGMGMAQVDRSAKNALLQGTSEVARTEAERHTEEMKDSQEYLTINAGSDLIISLLAPFKGEQFDE